ncbi:hypothetical protein HJC23_009413 [Cyclotella cryptica]|uniref:Conserved oligomeric Golgi complex subunit 1 n=1 Tax=Cyclotella cryptica TaxID=29204 RepID=A0ABD3PX72_9STRA
MFQTTPHPAPLPPQQPPPTSQPTTLTITEMRSLHASALTAVEAKRTELRLVLASRYRELVGSSDEVLRMRERAEELNSLVGGMGGLVEGVLRWEEIVRGAVDGGGEERETVERHVSTRDSMEGKNDETRQSPMGLEKTRASLSYLPRQIHRYLDDHDVHSAAYCLVELFHVICSASHYYPGGTTNDKSPFPLAAALCQNNHNHNHPLPTAPSSSSTTAALHTQTKMIYLHVQTLPSRIVQMARNELLRPACHTEQDMGGAYRAAAALSSLDLLDVRRRRHRHNDISGSGGRLSSDERRSIPLIDLYYDSKAILLNRLLSRLTLPSSTSSSSTAAVAAASSSSSSNAMGALSPDAARVTEAAESVLLDIVKILQYDVILYPYMIFVLRKFPLGNADVDGDQCRGTTANDDVFRKIMSTLPSFDADVLKAKASRFLAAHLPLIRTKVKSVLMVIAGTTASKLGRIRQSLYDKTDGVECMTTLDGNGVCSWEEAVGGTVDVRVVTHGTAFTPSPEEETTVVPTNGRTNAPSSTSTPRRFSLWGALFSNTFSSLVHSLLTASFHSVHARVVSTLRTSLARAPPFESMLPHEAHRNALRMATDLDGMLRKVSDDAHELLVHAEEREESERRLRQSLYVQTCEIMGRLLNELRRMLLVRHQGEENPARELIVGRLCHLLKFRLKTLPTLLDPKSSPAVLAAGIGGGKSTGMITRFELGSSFDLADDDDDGLISFDEAMEAMESAFSGTHFHGAEMVRDTLLLAQSSASTAVIGGPPSSSGVSIPVTNSSNKSAPKNVTLSELALLSARGLRHDVSGPESALGTVQSSLDDIVRRCFREWARAALSPSFKSFTNTLHDCIGVACTVSDMEWRRLNGLLDKEDDVLLKEIGSLKTDVNKLKPKQTVVGQVSPHVTSYLLSLAAVLNRSVCPADSLPPVPSLEYAQTLGISLAEKQEVPNMMLTIRGCLLGEAVTSLSHALHQEIITSSEDDGNASPDGNIKLNKCSPSSLIQILMDVQFINRCFFERNHLGFLEGFVESDKNYINDSREIMDSISEQLSKCVKLAVVDGASIDSAIRERHARVFTSCDLFLSSLFGEDDSNDSSTSQSELTNGFGRTSLLLASSDSSFLLNPLASSRRFVLLPIQAEKLTELQLRGKYGKKPQEEKTSSVAATSGNALGSGFGFLSSMLSTKTR